VITPRRTRLVRVPTLSAQLDALAAIVHTLDPLTAADTFVLVPTRAAGDELRRALEGRLLSPARLVVSWPRVGTRADLYAELHARAGVDAPLTPFEREVIVAGVARDVEDAGVHPPFRLRPALIAEIVALYDHIRRLDRTVADFDRHVRAELEPSADADRGAAQLLEQTRFLSAVFEGYEARLAGTALADEHTHVSALVAAQADRPLRHVVVTVADRTADPDGLWPVDFRVLATLPGLERIDVVATEALLASGWAARLDTVLPGHERHEEHGGHEGRGARPPALVIPDLRLATERVLVFESRDREEELADVARRIKAERRAGDRTPLHRRALVVRRPLPYLYLARSVFGGAGIPFEARDTLPLAAEPYAAALDLVLEFVISDYTRGAMLALLRSPHFVFTDDGREVPAEAVQALDRVLADARYLGGRDRLEPLVSAWSAIDAPADRDDRRRQTAAPAARAILAAARALDGLRETRPASDQIDTLLAFLERHDRAGEGHRDDRRTRVRAAVLGALRQLGHAYGRHDPAAQLSVADVSFAIRRWLGAKTFAARTGEPGLRILDAQTARFADADDVQLMGLVEGEWPERGRRSVFYPSGLLLALEPAPAAPIDPTRRESDELKAARAQFYDLLTLARRTARVSTFALEADAVVEPSTFVDDLAAIGLPIEPRAPLPPARVFADEALAVDPPRLDTLPDGVASWARVRLSDGPRDAARFHGEAGPWVMPRVSVSRVDRYLDCPFRFFASEVLKLEEQPEDEDVRPPLERGRFLHELFETFFRQWQEAGGRRITPADVPRAHAMMASICDTALAALSPSEATLERARLLGSAAGPGMVDRVLSLEADRPDDVRQRLIEYAVEGGFSFATADGGARTVTLSAKIDRVDVLADGTFRLIDYKSKYVPDVRKKIQLPIYASAVRQRLSAERGQTTAPSEAMYLSLEGQKTVAELKPAKGQTLAELIVEAEHRFNAVLDAVGQGHYPPQPEQKALCSFCPYATVCRKEYVEVADE
jgi:RecB family exonuclease